MEQTSNVTEGGKEQERHPNGRQPAQRRRQPKNLGEAERYGSILGGLGLILLICLIVYLMGGFRSKE